MLVTYNTTDLYLAAYILTKEIELLKIERVLNSKQCIFVFGNPPACKKAVKEFWNKKGSVIPKVYAEAIRNLKDRVFAEIKNMG